MTARMTRRPAMRVEVRLKELLEAAIDPETGRPMSGRELARRTGIRHRSVHYMMNGLVKEIPLWNLALICEELGCEPKDFFRMVPDDEAAAEES